MKKITFDLKGLQKKTKGTSLEGVVLLALILFAIIMILAYGYLFFRPVKSDLKTIIDDEVSSSDIIFDNSIINSIKERQKPGQAKPTSSGKNPFAGF